MTQRTFDELLKISAERREWAKQAREKDLHGSAKELDLTADLADELVEYRERYGATPDALLSGGPKDLK